VDAVNELVEFWRKCTLQKPPYIHPEDHEVLKSELEEYFDCSPSNFDSFIHGNRFGNFDDNHFYAQLYPAPYMGRLDTADIVILMLNPGFDYVDYYAEYRMNGIREIREKSLRQELDDVEFPFFWLNPEFCWHSGFMYWERKLRGVLNEIAQVHFKGQYLDALRKMSQRLATLQLIPYHSSKFDAHSLIERLPSISNIKLFVRNMLSPAASRGEKVLIVTRQQKAWGLNQQGSIVIYKSHQARGASLGKKSIGGQAILQRFSSTPPR
jgi:hypothetical protein